MFTGKLKKRHRLHFKPGVCSFATKLFFENKTLASGQVWPSVCTKEKIIIIIKKKCQLKIVHTTMI